MDSATLLRLWISLAATICLILVHSTPANSDVVQNRNPTAYDVVEHYDLPIGLLPIGVKGYKLNYTTGKFSVYLNDTCTFSEGLHKLKYKLTIKGYLSKGKMSKVEGISLRFFLTWMNIVEILGRGKYIDFYVEGGKAGFPMDHFEDSPPCSMNVARKLMENP